ncbi:MAG: segregation/condensation protein A [Clostridiales bacterium]|nr:segregation/condensation protein A [Clostridiales bacterium]
MKKENLEEIYADSYGIKLENFEGPIALLLHLVKESKMDIDEIHLADITEQYLDYIKDVEDLDLESASEFIQVASMLIEIKSKAILPVEMPEDTNDEIDPETYLKAKMKEYAIFQDASQELQRLEDINKLYKDPDKLAGNVKIVLKDMVLENLLDAFANLLCRVERKQESAEPKKIVKDRFTVAEKIVAIKSTIREKKHIKFTDLFEVDNTKSEMLNIFLALLELLKLQFVKAKQSELFGEIDIYENEEKAINE